MRHFKDIVLFVVTIFAAMLLATMVTILYMGLSPDTSEESDAVIYLCTVFVGAVFAGGHLMVHLHWSRRFAIIALAPTLFGVSSILVYAMLLDGTGSVAQKLRLAVEEHVTWFILAVGLLCGASFMRWRLATKATASQSGSSVG